MNTVMYAYRYETGVHPACAGPGAGIQMETTCQMPKY